MMRRLSPYIALVSLLLTAYVAQPGLATLLVLALNAGVLAFLIWVAHHERK